MSVATSPTVREVMSRSPVTIDCRVPLGTAMAMMCQHRVRHLPVVDDMGRFVGMLTDRDVRNVVLAPIVLEYVGSETVDRLQALAAELEVIPVRDVMTWDAMTIEPDAPLARAAAIMFEARIGSLGVVEHRRLVGIVTDHDVLRAFAATLPTINGFESDTHLRS